MECFFEHLLEKLYTGDSYSDTFDYTNKIRLLSAIAYNMYQNGYKLEKIKLYKFTKDYLKARKFAIDYTRIIDYFIDKGIFIEESSMIRNIFWYLDLNVFIGFLFHNICCIILNLELLFFLKVII